MTDDLWRSPVASRCGIGRRSRRSFRERHLTAPLTMPAMASQIEIYQDMSALSARMVEAARANDWERLIRLEKSVVALRRSLAEDDDNARLSRREAEIKHALIQRILDDDAEIRRHTEPWMEQVRQFLGGNASRKRVESAYGASS